MHQYGTGNRRHTFAELQHAVNVLNDFSNTDTIRNARIELGLSVRAVAKLMNRSVGNISTLEGGKYKPTPEHVLRYYGTLEEVKQRVD